MRVRHHSVFTDWMPSCHQTNSVKALKALTNTIQRKHKSNKNTRNEYLRASLAHASMTSCWEGGPITLNFMPCKQQQLLIKHRQVSKNIGSAFGPWQLVIIPPVTTSSLIYDIFLLHLFNNTTTTVLWPFVQDYLCEPLPEETTCLITTTTILRPFVRDYSGELVPEETLTHPPSWSSSNLYQLLPTTTIHSILLVQITCLAIFLHVPFHVLFGLPLGLEPSNLIFHTFLHPISVFLLK